MGILSLYFIESVNQVFYLRGKEGFGIDVSLLQDRSQRSFEHFSRMVGDRRISKGPGVEPNFMASRSLPVELESQSF